MPKVSVIVPVYNSSKYLSSCLKSIIKSSLQDIEIICIDNSSTDNSLEIINKFKKNDSRIKVISKENNGYGASMNLGINLAEGEYIGIVESDDFILKDMFKVLYDKAIQNDVDFIKSEFYRFHSSFLNIKLKKRFKFDKNYCNKVININDDVTPFKFPMNNWCGIYKRDFIIKNKILHNETQGASYQDNGFWFQVFSLSKKAYFINEAFYMNRRDNPKSSIYNDSNIDAIKIEYDFILDFLNRNTDIKKRYINVFNFCRYNAYMFNLNRINKKYRKSFVDTFYFDFLNASKNNELDYSLFNDIDVKNINLLLSDRDKFLLKYL